MSKKVFSEEEKTYKTVLLDDNNKETSVYNFLESMSAYYISDRLKEEFRADVLDAFNTAKMTERSQVLQYETDVIFIIHGNGRVQIGEVKDSTYYNLFTPYESAKEKVYRDFRAGKIKHDEFSEKVKELRELNERSEG